jgi:hypothetical protein
VRTGVFISAVSHVAVVALALLGTPKLFQNVPIETIEVDLVRPDEAEPPPKEPEKKPPDESAEWTPLADPSAAQAQPAAPETPSPQADLKQPPATQQARAAPQPSPAQTPAQQQQPWIFDPVNIPALMNLPNAPQAGFDAEASTAANLSADERSAFKQHLKKCWKLPDGMSETQSTRVTLRVFLKRDGSVAGEPMLIEASASRDGPQLMQAAIRSVKDCQPYAFLPPDRYREWKALDVTFSPKEMAGG